MKFIIELEFIGNNNTKEIYDELHDLFRYFELIWMRSFFLQIHLGDFRDYKEIEKKDGCRERPPT